MSTSDLILTITGFSIISIVLFIKDFNKKLIEKNNKKRNLQITILALQNFDMNFMNFLDDNLQIKSSGSRQTETIILGLRFNCNPKNKRKIEKKIIELVNLYITKPEVHNKLNFYQKMFKDAIFEEHKDKIIESREATGMVLDIYKYAGIINEIFDEANIHSIRKQDIKIPKAKFLEEFSKKLKVPIKDADEILQSLSHNSKNLFIDTFQNDIRIGIYWFIPTHKEYEVIQYVINKELPEPIFDYYIGFE